MATCREDIAAEDSRWRSLQVAGTRVVDNDGLSARVDAEVRTDGEQFSATFILRLDDGDWRIGSCMAFPAHPCA